jgi:hypothetical protein
MAAESDIEKKVRNWALSHNILCYKFTSPGRSGVPDRMFIRDGKVVFVELKSPGKFATPLQMREIVLIKSHGIPAIWSSSFEDTTHFLTKHLL